MFNIYYWFRIGIVISLISPIAGIVFGVAFWREMQDRKKSAILITISILLLISYSIIIKWLLVNRYIIIQKTLLT